MTGILTMSPHSNAELDTVSVGVCAYNEERTIAQCLESILSQELGAFVLTEVVVVSSASVDRTDQIVEEFSSRDPRVRLVRQPLREGKSSAVNLFMEQAHGRLLVLVNADNRLERGALDALLTPFLEEKVGMVGGHPLPLNDKSTIVGFGVNMLWEMHHHLSSIVPKTGELIAFRNIGVRIPQGVNTDEDWIRMEVERRGLEVRYAADAIVYNRGPETVREFIWQRTRVNIGERYMKRRYAFEVPTWNPRLLLPALTLFVKDNGRHLVRLFPALALELFSRVYATVHVAMDRGDPYIWRMIDSSKRL